MWILVVIMVWRSDLFNILTCSALSSLKVNAIHHWSHKALLEGFEGRVCAWVFLILMGLKRLWVSFSSAAVLNWLYLLTGEEKYILSRYFSRGRLHKRLWGSFLFGLVFLLFPVLLSEVLGTMSTNYLFSVLFICLFLQWTCGEAGGLKIFRVNLCVYSPKPFYAIPMLSKPRFAFWFVNIIIL